MNAYDPMVWKNLRDADRYSDLCNEGDLKEKEAAAQDVQTNAVCMAIRKCDLSRAQVTQILATLACEMKRAGHEASDYELVEYTADAI